MTQHDLDTATTITTGHLVSVNVGPIRQIEWLGEIATTAIWKSPVSGHVPVRGINLVGDDQADRRVHGGPDKAVYSYAREDQEWWAQGLGRPMELGVFGENLTLAEIDITSAVIGERWRVGTALFEISQPRSPCWKLGARMNDPAFPQHFARAFRPGAYLRIIEEGEVGAGDTVTILSRPSHGLTIGKAARIYEHDRQDAEQLLVAPELAASWVAWAHKVIRHRKEPHH